MLTALIVILIIAACGGSAGSNTDCPSGAIVAFGDSITYGAGIPREDSYPSQLANRIQQHVCNAGINGDRVEDGLDRLQRDVLSHRPAAVVILLGANDVGLFGFPTEPAQFSKSLSSIVERIRSSGAEPLLCSLLPIDAQLLKSSLLQPERWSEYDNLVRAVAVDKAVPLVDLATAIDGRLDLLLDGLHPTAAGSTVIAEAVAGALISEGLATPVTG
ncbi:MAG: SGNH/GDSL hydrolase family protein [Dehalococcoidia bacterium]